MGIRIYKSGSRDPDPVKIGQDPQNCFKVTYKEKSVKIPKTQKEIQVRLKIINKQKQTIPFHTPNSYPRGSLHIARWHTFGFEITSMPLKIPTTKI